MDINIKLSIQSTYMKMSHKVKICSICGCSESANWARHWKRQHPTSVIKELAPGELPSKPFDENWMFLIKSLNLREVFIASAKI